MEGKPVVNPIDPDTLSYKENSKELEAVNHIKENRNKIIKGRTCADGSKQNSYLKEGERISSPMVSLEALFCTLIIDAHEGHDVDTFDVPRSYRHADMPKDKRILMKIRGDFIYIMCQVNPEYEQHARYENEKNVLYLLVLREIYD